MKRILVSLVIVVSLIGSANMFGMDKLTQAERAKVITAAKAAKGDEQKFQAAIKSIPKATGITLADALPASKPVQAKGGAETGEVVVQFFGEEVPLKTSSAVTTKPAAKKGIVITEAQKAALEKEIADATRMSMQARSKAYSLALSLGNQEDARAFMQEINARADSLNKQHMAEYMRLTDEYEAKLKLLPSAPQ